MKIIAGVHSELRRPLRDRRPARRISARRAMRSPPASAWCIRSSASRPTSRSPRTSSSASSRRTASASCEWRRMAREAEASSSRRFGIDVDPERRIGDLPIGLQQLIEIARVLFSGARIIILDEPTSALSPPEVERLFAVLRRLRDGRHAASSSSRISSTTSCASPTPSRCSATAARSLTTPAAGDQQGRADRAHDRRRPRRSSRRATPTTSRSPRPSDAPVRARSATASVARRAPIATSRSRSAPARCSASTASWAAASCELARTLFGKLKPDSGTLSGRRPRDPLRAAPRRRAAPASPSCRRAGAPCCFARSRSTRTSRSASSTASRAAAEAGAGARHRPAPGRALQIRPPRVEASISARSPAATSRRSRWRNG